MIFLFRWRGNILRKIGQRKLRRGGILPRGWIWRRCRCVAMSRFSSSKPMIPGGIEAANQGGEGVPPLFQIRESVFEHLSTDLNPTGQYEGTKKSRRRRQLLPQGRAEGTIVRHESYLRTIRWANPCFCACWVYLLGWGVPCTRFTC
jgi:hypothetical protein